MIQLQPIEGLLLLEPIIYKWLDKYHKKALIEVDRLATYHFTQHHIQDFAESSTKTPSTFVGRGNW